MVDETNDGAVITVTDATGTTTAKLKNGKDGNPGQNATDEQVRTAVEAYMEEHPQGDTEDIIKLAIKNEASGAVPVVITDSADMGVQDIKMQGWTEQAQYEGKNLFDKTKIEDRIDTTHTQTDTGIEVSGLYFVTYRGSVPPNTDMRISYNKSGKGNNQVSIYGTDISSDSLISISYGKGMEFNTGKHTEIVVVFYCSGGTEKVTIYNDVMLNLGSTALPYEPYTGGQPSPSPDYPQPIISAGKYNEEAQKYEYQVKLTGKNLWNAEEAAETSKWVASKTQKGYSDFAIDVAPGQQITFSFPEKLPLGITMYVAIVSIEDGNVAKWLYHSTSENLIVQQATITAITDKIWVRCNTGSIEGFVQDNPYFQIEYGSKRTAFQPYKEQTVTLTSDRPLTKWDKLEKRGGQWGWVYGSAEIVCDGSEAWVLTGATSDEYQEFALKSSDYNAMKSNLRLVCDKFAYSTSDKINTCRQEKSEHGLRFVVSTEYVPNKTVAEFKNWLQSNQITVLYHLAEPVFTPLSEAEQEQMNELCTYYPTTVLDNDQGCDMALTYIADTKAYIDNKISAIQAVIVNTI